MLETRTNLIYEKHEFSYASFVFYVCVCFLTWQLNNILGHIFFNVQHAHGACPQFTSKNIFTMQHCFPPLLTMAWYQLFGTRARRQMKNYNASDITVRSNNKKNIACSQCDSSSCYVILCAECIGRWFPMPFHQNRDKCTLQRWH